MWQVYILRCGDGSLYVGHTADLAERVARHSAGRGAHHTALRLPVVLLYAEAAASKREAVARECQIKRWTRRKKEALAAGDLAALKRL